MSIELSDSQIAKEIELAIRNNPDNTYGSEGEFISFLNLGISATRIKRVLRRMVRGHTILYQRDPRTHIDSYIERPITLGLPGARVTR